MFIGEPPRRVVTGLDEEGQSCILFDGPSDVVIWQTQSHPVDNSGATDRGAAQFSFPSGDGHSAFIVFDFPPAPGILDPGMHATDTIDYIVVISGEVVLITESGECVLRAGDVAVDRGVYHGWRNDSGKPARLGIAFVKAQPVGKGATL